MVCLKKVFPALFLVFILLLSFSGNGIAKEESVIKVYNHGVQDWDPSVVYGTENRLLENIYEHLLMYDGGKLVPKLATSYEKSADGNVWTFHLRKGVKFHNGESFNAEAVKFSIERVINMNKGAAWIWASLKEVKVVDDYTVQFICNSPAPVDILASSQYASYMIPPKLYKDKDLDWFQKGNAIGTGPYKLVSWEKDVQAIVEKFDEYWGGWKPNQYDKAIFIRAHEASTRIQLLQKGELHSAIDILPESVPALEKNPDLEVVWGDTFRTRCYHFHTQKSPTDDINVRKAICHAINYDELVENLYGRKASKAIGPIPQTLWSHDPNLKIYEYDLEKAKQLLKKSKYADQLAKGPMKITLANHHDDATTTSLYIQGALKKIGFEVEIDATPWPAAWDRHKNKEAACNLQMISWWPTYPTPVDFFMMWHTEQEPLWNWSYWYNPAFDKLVDEGQSLEGGNREKAIELYKKAQQMLLDEAVSLFVCDLKSLAVNRKEVKGFRFYPAYQDVIYIYELHR